MPGTARVNAENAENAEQTVTLNISKVPSNQFQTTSSNYYLELNIGGEVISSVITTPFSGVLPLSRIFPGSSIDGTIDSKGDLTIFAAPSLNNLKINTENQLTIANHLQVSNLHVNANKINIQSDLTVTNKAKLQFNEMHASDTSKIKAREISLESSNRGARLFNNGLIRAASKLSINLPRASSVLINNGTIYSDKDAKLNCAYILNYGQVYSTRPFAIQCTDMHNAGIILSNERISCALGSRIYNAKTAVFGSNNAELTIIRSSKSKGLTEFINYGQLVDGVNGRCYSSLRVNNFYNAAGAVVNLRVVDFDSQIIINDGDINGIQSITIWNKLRKLINGATGKIESATVDIRSIKDDTSDCEIYNYGRIRGYDRLATFIDGNLTNYNELESDNLVFLKAEEVANKKTINSNNEASLVARVITLAEGSCTHASKLFISAIDPSQQLGSLDYNKAAMLKIEQNARVTGEEILLFAHQRIDVAGSVEAQVKLQTTGPKLEVAKTGELISNQDMQLNIDNLIDNSGTIEAKKSLLSRTRGKLLNQKFGKINSDESLRLDANELINKGDITSQQAIVLQIVQAFSQQAQGRLLAGLSLNLLSCGDISLSGKVSAKGHALLKATRKFVVDKGADLYSGEILELSSYDLHNNGALSAKQQAFIRVLHDYIANEDAKIASLNVTIDAMHDMTNAGEISAEGSVELSAGINLSQAKSSKVVATNIQARAGSIYQSGTWQATKFLDAEAKISFENKGISAARKAQIKAVHYLKNSGMLTASEFTLQADIIDNLEQAYIDACSKLRIESRILDNSGEIRAQAKLQSKLLDLLYGDQITSKIYLPNITKLYQQLQDKYSVSIEQLKAEFKYAAISGELHPNSEAVLTKLANDESSEELSNEVANALCAIHDVFGVYLSPFDDGKTVQDINDLAGNFLEGVELWLEGQDEAAANSLLDALAEGNYAESYITTSGKLTNNGEISADQLTMLNREIYNYGKLIGQQGAWIEVQGVINNYAQGIIQSEQALYILADILENHGVLKGEEHAALELRYALYNHRAGLISSDKLLKIISAHSLINMADISAEGLSLQVANTLENMQSGKITATESLEVISEMNAYNNGLIKAKQSAISAKQYLANQRDGKIYASELALVSGHEMELDGQIAASKLAIDTEIAKISGELQVDSVYASAREHLTLLTEGKITCKQCGEFLAKLEIKVLGQMISQGSLAFDTRKFYHRSIEGSLAADSLKIKAIDAVLTGKTTVASELIAIIENDFSYQSASLATDGILRLKLKNGQVINHDLNTAGDLVIEFFDASGKWHNLQELQAGKNLVLNIPGHIFINGRGPEEGFKFLQEGVIKASQQLAIQSAATIIHDLSIVDSNDLSIESEQLLEIHRSLEVGGSLHLQSKSVMLSKLQRGLAEGKIKLGAGKNIHINGEEIVFSAVDTESENGMTYIEALASITHIPQEIITAGMSKVIQGSSHKAGKNIKMVAGSDITAEAAEITAKNISLQAGGVIDLHGAVGLVYQDERNYQQVLERSKLTAAEKIKLEADYLQMSAVQTTSGSSTTFIGKRGITDTSEQLEARSFRSINGGTTSSYQQQHQLSTHQAGEDVTYISPQGAIDIYAVTLHALRAKMIAKEHVTSHTVKDIINTVTQITRKKKRFAIFRSTVTEQHQSQQSISVGSKFAVEDTLKVIAEELISLEQVFSQASVNYFKAKTVEFKSGHNSFEMEANTSSSDLFWQKAVTEKVSSTTHIPCIFKDDSQITIDAGKTILEQVEGKSSSWMHRMLDKNGETVAPIVAILRDHYHYEKDVKQGPGAGLSILVTIAVAMATAGSGAAAAKAVGCAADGLAASVMQAGITSLASSAAIGLLENEGDPFAAGRALGSSKNFRGLLTSMVTAGVLHGLGDLGNFNIMEDGLPKDLLVNARKALVNFGVCQLDSKNDSKLGTSMLNCFVSSITGNLSKDIELNIDSEQVKAVTNGLVGGLGSFAITGNSQAALCGMLSAVGTSLYSSYSDAGKTLQDKVQQQKAAEHAGHVSHAGHAGHAGHASHAGHAKQVEQAKLHQADVDREQGWLKLMGGLSAMFIAKDARGVQAGVDAGQMIGDGQEKAAKARFEAVKKTRINDNFQLLEQGIYQDFEIDLANDREKLKKIYIQKIIGEFKSKDPSKFSELSDEHIYSHILSNYGATIDLCLDDIEKAGHGNIKLGLHRIGIAKYTQQQHSEEIKKEECAAPIAEYYMLLGMSAAFTPIFINCYQRFMDYDFSQEQPSNSSNDFSSSSTVLPIHQQDKGDNIETFPIDDEKYELGVFGHAAVDSAENTGEQGLQRIGDAEFSVIGGNSVSQNNEVSNLSSKNTKPSLQSDDDSSISVASLLWKYATNQLSTEERKIIGIAINQGINDGVKSGEENIFGTIRKSKEAIVDGYFEKGLRAYENRCEKSGIQPNITSMAYAGPALADLALSIIPDTPQKVATDVALAVGVQQVTSTSIWLYQGYKGRTVIKNLETVADAPFPPGSINAGKVWTTKGRISAHNLPNEGKIRYIPPEGYNPSNPLKKGPNGGIIDRFDNEWIKGPSRTAGEMFEWDVQLSSAGKNKLGWASKSGSHVNVSLKGHITH